MSVGCVLTMASASSSCVKFHFGKVVIQKSDFVQECMKPQSVFSKLSNLVQKVSFGGLSLFLGAGAALWAYTTWKQYENEENEVPWTIGNEISNVLAMLSGFFYFSSFPNYVSDPFVSGLCLFGSLILPLCLRNPESGKLTDSFLMPSLTLPMAFWGGQFFV